MPCRCDYRDPDVRERESRLVARLIKYVMKKLDKDSEIADDIIKAASNDYGMVAHLDEHTKLLCSLCVVCTGYDMVSNDKIFDINSQDGRDLAAWWQKHQKMDADRRAKEAEDKKLTAAKKRALQKLTPLERKALGIKD